MNPDGDRHLAELRTDYESVTGTPFRHFYCPILWQDEETELCRAHVINRAFRNSDRVRTIQRADLDAWFGSMFEKDFLALEQRGHPIVEQAFTDPHIARRFKPKLTVNDELIDYYFAREPVSDSHTTVDIDIRDRRVQLALKLSPSEFSSRIDGRWELQARADLRLPALASVLKAAYLTMFHLLGYRYALSPGGYLLGRQILGELFLKCRGIERAPSLSMAEAHLKPFAGMVRPVLGSPAAHAGTITDRLVRFFVRAQDVWACQVLVRTGDHAHAVVVPILDHADSAVLFSRFLESPARKIEVRQGRLFRDASEISSESHTIEWPDAPFDI